METQPVALPLANTLFWVTFGILASLILPVVTKVIQNAKFEAQSSLWERIVKAWKDYSGKRYLTILIAAIVLAILLVFLLDLEFFKIRDAALSGIAWESLVNKVVPKKSNGT